MITSQILARRVKTWKYLLKIYAKILLGKEVRIFSEDRRILEQVLIPHYVSRDDIRKVLFIGCNPYTAHFPRMWPGIEYWTIDVNPRQKRYGSDNHIVDTVENLRSHFEKEYFDLIICNGVYGYGLNTKPVCERAFQACYDCLRGGGEFLFGWNQLPEYTPVPLTEIIALMQFQPNPSAVLGEWRFVCDSSMFHTYDFYVKPAR
jgi:SAM-dependent methyltransferase